jgi:hypothetical protein
MLIVLYFSAAFWKLTTSWFDTHYSCATVLMSELLAGLEPLLPPLALVAEPMLLMAPALVAGIEFAVRSPVDCVDCFWIAFDDLLIAFLIRCRRCCCCGRAGVSSWPSSSIRRST